MTVQSASGCTRAWSCAHGDEATGPIGEGIARPRHVQPAVEGRDHGNAGPSASSRFQRSTWAWMRSKSPPAPRPLHDRLQVRRRIVGIAGRSEGLRHRHDVARRGPASHRWRRSSRHDLADPVRGRARSRSAPCRRRRWAGQPPAAERPGRSATDERRHGRRGSQANDDLQRPVLAQDLRAGQAAPSVEEQVAGGIADA